MAEYIEREVLMEYPIRINHYDKEHGKLDFVLGIESVLEYAEALPTADVVEVTHGRWEYHDCVCTGEGLAAVYACSNCRFCIDEEVFEQLNATDFCNCCGARMDGEG